jgi:hypothetical protein
LLHHARYASENLAAPVMSGVEQQIQVQEKGARKRATWHHATLARRRRRKGE